MKTWTEKYSILLGACVCLLLNACTVTEPTLNNNRGPIEEALKDSLRTNQKLKTTHQYDHTLPPALQKALMPEVGLPNVPILGGEKPEPRFDIAVNNVPAKDFFMGLVKGTAYNITINPLITGNISLGLKSVTIPQAMEAIRDNYGFEYERTAYGYKVFPRHLETKIFHINYLDIDRSGQSQTSVGSGQITNTIQNTMTSLGVSSSQQPTSTPSGLVQTSSSTKFWDMLKENLTTIIGTKEDRSVVINSRSGVIIVRAYPDELRAIAEYLDKIQNIVHRQVIIEAKIIEVQLSADFQNGINWKLLGLQQGEIIGGTPNFPNSIADRTISANSGTGNANSQALPVYAGNIVGYLSMQATSGNAFGSVMSLLNSQGKVNVLSSPKISAINNQKAVIKVGSDRFYVTNVSSNTTSGSGTLNQNTQSNITLTPFFSGISLDVTPQIDENDYVTIHIHPIVSQVTMDKQTLTVDNKSQVLPLAMSTTRESDNVVRTKNGQVIVIGGLMETNGGNAQSSTPGLDRLPGVGGLFKNTNRTTTKSEIIILMRTTIVEGSDTWQQQLQETATRIKQMQGNFNYEVVPAKKNR